MILLERGEEREGEGQGYKSRGDRICRRSA